MMKVLLIFAVSLNLQFLHVSSHGRLVEPPSRSSAWRYGFNTPPEYTDNQGFCGGFAYQYEKAGGKCGICGDPWNGPRTHEAPGGKYATGTIVRSYAAGQTIKVTIEVTANHWGKFTFKLCASNNPNKDPTQECFDRTVLRQPNGDDKWSLPNHNKQKFDIDLVLPSGVTCSQCILQWTYKTANSWGVDPDGTGCIGCGPQEHFRACADISIGGSGSSQTNPAPPTNPGNPAPPTNPGNPAPPTDTGNPAPPTNPGNPPPPSGGHRDCVAAGAYKNSSGMTNWCKLNCNGPNASCPATHCKCNN